ncbi:hypothetical protein ABIB81_007302 [Bradyrhizobium sp. I1.7.5]
MWRIKSLIVTGRLSGSSASAALPSSAFVSTPTFIAPKAGMYFATGSSSESLPCSTSIIAMTVVTGFDIE